jgi:tartrate dehydratase beta subunit/fumarate hydratase class I family protein
VVLFARDRDHVLLSKRTPFIELCDKTASASAFRVVAFGERDAAINGCVERVACVRYESLDDGETIAEREALQVEIIASTALVDSSTLRTVSHWIPLDRATRIHAA